METSDLLLRAALGLLVLVVHFGEFLALWRAARERAERVLERLGLLHPKAEVIDLSDFFVSRRIRRELARELERDLSLGRPDPEPPRSA